MTKVTGGQGKYGFLVGDNEYIIAPSRTGYLFTGEKASVRPQNGIVQKDFGMNKSQEGR